MKRLVRLGGPAAMAALLAFLLFSMLGILHEEAKTSPMLVEFIPKPSTAEAKIIIRSISPETLPAAVLGNGAVRVKGVIHCTAGQTLALRVTLTQGSAEAQQEASSTCTGHIQPWTVHVPVAAGQFKTGPASVRVWSSTLEDGDEFVWIDDVKIVGPPAALDAVFFP